tara:strand:- start:347 stop:517 length:171 start_codon:yes stop_codon:yes gene_type:complete
MIKIKHFLFLFVILIYSCEDDPLLEPQTESEDGGSYGLLSWPESKDENPEKNPEVF